MCTKQPDSRACQSKVISPTILNISFEYLDISQLDGCCVMAIVVSKLVTMAKICLNYC